ncbi:MAG: methyltransferase [Acidobacteriota bacterium]|nr:methyltransferase [Acidobacteriota bacterium]
MRRGREGLELRVDGTLASLHRPGQGVTGVVWWTLAAPILLVPRRRRRVLLLGLGGGSVGRAVRALDPAAEIVGVERNTDVLRLARDHLELDRLRFELVMGDALEYLHHERRRFDLIVEDLFVGPSRSVRKPDWLLDEGYPLIGRRRRAQGVVVSNTIHEMPGVVRAMRALGGRIVSFDVRGHWNRIVAGGPGLPPPVRLRQVFRGHPSLARILPRLAVRSRG